MLRDVMAHGANPRRLWRFGPDRRRAVEPAADKLALHRIALEINSRYRIPSVKVLKKAKARGLKFAFGTNNGDANIGRLEWALGAARECGLEKGDMWFPPDSVRMSRKTVVYNKIEEGAQGRGGLATAGSAPFVHCARGACCISHDLRHGVREFLV